MEYGASDSVTWRNPLSKWVALGLLLMVAHGNEVHVVYSNWYGPDRRKSIT